MRSQKILFIIIWKIAKLLVIPKKHYQRFEKFTLLLIIRLDMDIIEIPAHI